MFMYVCSGVEMGKDGVCLVVGEAGREGRDGVFSCVCVRVCVCV